MDREKPLSLDINLTAILRAIVRSSEKFEVGILRPSEWEILRDALDINMKRICTSLLVTGMRYAELQRFRKNPDWLDGRFVHLPRGSMMKVKAKQKERAIRLSDIGKTLISDLFQAPHPLPELPAFDMKLRNWKDITDQGCISWEPELHHTITEECNMKYHSFPSPKDIEMIIIANKVTLNLFFSPSHGYPYSEVT